MGRQRSTNRDEAFNLFKASDGRLSSNEIAAQLGEKINNIKTWRVKDKWKDKVGKVGAPYGNKNSVGNSGGGAPLRNKNHYIHGFFSRYFPQETYDIMKDIDKMDPLDMLWHNICIKFAAIIRSQKIMYVKDHEDLTREIKKTKREFDIKNKGTRDEPDFEALETYDEIEYELQFAWDKQAAFLKAQSVAMGQLTNMIRRYDDMLHANWELATEEQRQRIEKIKLQIKNPELQHQKEKTKVKQQFDRERFEHQKKMDDLKNF